MGQGTRQLPLFRVPKTAQPRDKAGRFARVRHNSERAFVLTHAARIRAELGMPPHPSLTVRAERK
jgi:hypothetical protein